MTRDGFCSMRMPESSDVRLWPGSLRWWLDVSGAGPRIAAVARSVYAAAMQEIASYVEIEVAQADSPADADSVSAFGAIDGPRGVLAESIVGWSPSPHDPARPDQLFDDAEDWTVAEVMTTHIDLYRVMLHENLHRMGLGHVTDGTPSIMAPAISDLRHMQPVDVQNLLALGYRPRTGPAPGPPPAPPPAAATTITLAIAGNVLTVAAPGLVVKAP